MATIVENIQTLQSIKSDIKNAIIEKGGSVTDAFGGYAQAIKDLPSGGGDTTIEDYLVNGYFLGSEYTNNRVSRIASYRFADANIEVASFPNVTNIKNGIFYDAQLLKSIDLPKITSLPCDTFYQCYQLNYVNLPEVTKIDDANNPYTVYNPTATSSERFIYQRGAFENAGLEMDWETEADPTFNMPKCTYIGERAFMSANWQGGYPSMLSTGQVTYIGSHAFDGFNAGQGPNHLFLENCSYIGDYAFTDPVGNNMLNSIYLGDTFLENWAFYSIQDTGRTYFYSSGNGRFVLKSSTAVPPKALTRISSAHFAWGSAHSDIRSSRTAEKSDLYGIDGFFFTSNVSEVIIPNCWHWGNYAFSDATNIKSITIGVKRIETKLMDDRLRKQYNTVQKLVLNDLTYMTSYAFASMFALSYVEMNNVSSTAANIFQYCSALKEVHMDNCSYVGMMAFANQSKVNKSVYIDNVKSIGQQAFYKNSGLTLYMRSVSSVPQMGYQVFSSTTVNAMYVPTSLVDSFKTAPQFSIFSNVIYGV